MALTALTEELVECRQQKHQQQNALDLRGPIELIEHGYLLRSARGIFQELLLDLLLLAAA